MNWKFKYAEKFGVQCLMNTLYPYKKEAIQFFHKNNLKSENDIYKYCYINNINANSFIEIPSDEEIKSQLKRGLLIE